MGQATINELRIGSTNQTNTSNQIEVYNSGNVPEAVWRTWKLIVNHQGTTKGTYLLSSSSEFTAAGQFIYNSNKAIFLENKSGKHKTDIALVDASGNFIDYVAVVGTNQSVPSCMGTPKVAPASSDKGASGNLSRVTDGSTWPSTVTSTSSHTIGKSNNCNASGNDLAVAYSADQPSPVVNTTTVNYTLTVSNKNCSGTVSGIKVTATNISSTNFPTTGANALAYSTTSPANTGTRTLVGNNLEWSGITLAAGASATLTITGKPKVLGTLSSVASITSPTGLVNTSNDSDTETINVVDYNYVGFDVTTATLIEGTDLTYEAAISTSVVSNQAVTVNYTVSCSPLCSGDTNLPASGTLTLPANDGTGSIDFTITNDAVYEPNKTIVITITSISSADSGIRLSTPNNVLTLTLENDDIAQCGPLGDAAERPLWGWVNLNMNGAATVNSGGGNLNITGSGRAVNAATGVRLNPDPTPRLPELVPTSFPANASTTDTSAATVAAGSWRNVTVGAGTTTTFAGGTTSVELLEVSAGATLRLTPGTYNVRWLRMANTSAIVAASSGVVRINVGANLTLADNITINASGGPADMQVFVYPNANVQAGINLRAALVIYANSNSSNIQFGNNATISGALIANSIGLSSIALTYTSAMKTAARAIDTCSVPAPAATGPDHYELSMSTSSLACLPSTVTVKACSNNTSPCTSNATDLNGRTATLATSAGTLGSSTLTFDATGVATTTLSHAAAADGASVSVTLSGEQTAATNPRQCCANGTACSVANSCSTTFNTAGLIYSSSANGSNIGSFPAQVAGTSSGTYYLRAVQTSTTTKACEAALTGAATVNWGVVCVNPATCSTGNLMSLTGSGGATAIANNPNGSATSFSNVAMTFDANGNAPFSFTYNDAGRIRLDSKMTVNSATLSGVNSSSSHVTRPASFTVSSIRQTSSGTANPAASSAVGSRFVKAGESFSATVTAVTSGGAATPNFGKESTPEGVTLSANLVLPSGGASGAISNGSIAGTSFVNGAAAVSNLSYSEVGIISLTPSLTNASYINTGGTPSGTATSNIGRFYPAQFALSGGTVAHRSGASCSPASAFTYLGENFQLALTLTAQNTAGATTANYSGAFAKFDPTSAAGWNVAGLGGTTTFSTGSGRLSLGTATGSWANGVASNVAITANASRASAADGPFSAAFGVAPVDSDGVTMSTLNMASTASGTADRTSVSTVPLRFGRLRLANAVGGQSRALSLPLTAQYWTGTAFDTNTLDSCTAIAATHVSFGNLRKTLTTADTSVSGSSFGLSSGVGALKIGAPLGGRYGTVDVTLSLGSSAADASCLQTWTPGNGDAATAGANLSFLRGAWCGGTYVNDPSARASFGLYRGADAMVYQRENY